MTDHASIREFLTKFDNGDFDSSDVDTQIDAGWYDWFCTDKSLRNKTYKLTTKLKQIVKSPKINQDIMYVFFTNNCPGIGSLYDDFRICSLETGEVVYTITPSSGHKSDKGVASIWGKENEFKEPILEGSWNDVVLFFTGVDNNKVAEEKKEEKRKNLEKKRFDKSLKDFHKIYTCLMKKEKEELVSMFVKTKGKELISWAKENSIIK